MKIVIDGVIGWDYTTSDMRKAISEASGQNLDIEISSPGGSVFVGNTIFNLLLKYKSDYPNAQINITSFGISASMASIIALAGDKHIVYDNTAYMIHNAWSFSIGDHRELEKMAKVLEKMDSSAARVYAQKSGKTIKEIRQKMDDETFFFGQEIIDYGLADEIIQAKKEEDKEEKLAFAKLAVEEVQNNLKNDKDFDYANDLFQAAALLESIDKSKIQSNNKNDLINSASADIEKTEVTMNLEELKKNHPEAYAQAVQVGRDEEFDRVQAHITMGKQSGGLEIAMKNIEDKKDFTQAVTAEYMAAAMKNQAISNRKEDDVDTGAGRTGEDDEADTKAWTAELLKLRGAK